MLRKTKGFTLIEAMIVVAMMGVMAVGLSSLMKNTYDTWITTTNRMKLQSEARLIMILFTKLVQNSQDTTIKISRLDTNQPANSYIGGRVMETVYVTTSTPGGCGFSTSGTEVIGGSGDDFAIYQNGRYIIGKYPSLPAGANIENPGALTFTYKYVTLSASAEQFQVAFEDSSAEKAISAVVRLSAKTAYNKATDLMLKQKVIVKHHYSSGFYGD